MQSVICRHIIIIECICFIRHPIFIALFSTAFLSVSYFFVYLRLISNQFINWNICHLAKKNAIKEICSSLSMQNVINMILIYQISSFVISYLSRWAKEKKRHTKHIYWKPLNIYSFSYRCINFMNCQHIKTYLSPLKCAQTRLRWSTETFFPIESNRIEWEYTLAIID